MIVSKKNIINDTLVRLKNASLVYKKSIFINNTGNIVKLLQVLFDEGFILGYKLVIVQGVKKVEVFLSYSHKKHFFNKIRFFSKKSAPLYVSLFFLSKIHVAGDELIILEIPEGFTTLFIAKKRKIGGKLLCQIG